MSRPTDSGAPSNPLGQAGDAAADAGSAGIDIASQAVNGTVNGLATAAQMASDGIATAITASEKALTDLLPFMIDAAVVSGP